MWDVKEPTHYSKRVGREVPGVVAVLCVVNTGPILIAVTTITEMVILYKYVEMMISASGFGPPFADLDPPTKHSFFPIYSNCKLLGDVL